MRNTSLREKEREKEIWCSAAASSLGRHIQILLKQMESVVFLRLWHSGRWTDCIAARSPFFFLVSSFHSYGFVLFLSSFSSRGVDSHALAFIEGSVGEFTLLGPQFLLTLSRGGGRGGKKKGEERVIFLYSGKLYIIKPRLVVFKHINIGKQVFIFHQILSH